MQAQEIGGQVSSSQSWTQRLGLNSWEKHKDPDTYSRQKSHLRGSRPI